MFGEKVHEGEMKRGGVRRKKSPGLPLVRGRGELESDLKVVGQG